MDGKVSDVKGGVFRAERKGRGRAECSLYGGKSTGDGKKRWTEGWKVDYVSGREVCKRQKRDLCQWRGGRINGRVTEKKGRERERKDLYRRGGRMCRTR